MILTVFLSDKQQLLTEVPITPETLCRDVVEFCKEVGESGCHLAEVWRDKGTKHNACTFHPAIYQKDLQSVQNVYMSLN